MHYSKKVFSKNGKDTITPLKPMNGAIMGQRYEADDQDILKIRLLYQCVSGSRTLSEYDANRCTTDCKCWEYEEGCRGNGGDNACQGSLVCMDDKCMKRNDYFNPTPVAPPVASPVN